MNLGSFSILVMIVGKPVCFCNSLCESLLVTLRHFASLLVTLGGPLTQIKMYQDPLGEIEALERMAEVNDVRTQLEAALGQLLRKAARGTINFNTTLPDGTPDVSKTIDKLVDVTRSRLGKQAFGLTTNASLLAGVFKRILIKRGHLEPAHESLLPPNWLSDAACLVSTWFQGLPGYLEPVDRGQVYNYVQGIWNSVDEKGATRATCYRERQAKRQREEGGIAVMREMMDTFVKPCLEVLRSQGAQQAQLLVEPPHAQLQMAKAPVAPANNANKAKLKMPPPRPKQAAPAPSAPRMA